MLKNIGLAIIAALAIGNASAGDATAGKIKSALCQGCHGEDGNSAVPIFPKLAGQYAGYIEKQINDFQQKLRKDDTMSPMADTLTEREDIGDIAAYFASQPKMAGTPSENAELIAQGAKLYVAYGCLSCHGENGKGKRANSFPFIPIVGGQHKNYLVEQFNKFRNGMRANDRSETMDELAKTLKPEEVDAIAEYLSGV